MFDIHFAMTRTILPQIQILSTIFKQKLPNFFLRVHKIYSRTVTISFLSMHKACLDIGSVNSDGHESELTLNESEHG